MKKTLVKIFIVAFCSLEGQHVLSQVTITGPFCILPGITYQYNIQGSWDSASTMQVCITGGVLIGSNSSSGCTTGNKVVSDVLVTWNNVNSGSLNISSNKGNTNLSVNIISPLNAGAIGGSVKSQMINTGTTPVSISCSVATGGACSPAYTYQWQESPNSVSWNDISGASSKDLKFSAAIIETKYYRRKTIETVSGTIAYSDVAMIGAIVTIPTLK
jgi:hypothetical protein